MERVREILPEVSERRACRVLNQARVTQCHRPIVRDDEALLTRRIIGLACQYGRYGYRRIDVARRLNSEDVLERLAWLFATHGVPEYLRSDNGSEFTAQAVREWLAKVAVKTLYIEPASPWENGYVESFNGKLRDELLNVEIFYTVQEAKVLIERWRREYNTVRPHSALGYRPPAPQALELARPAAGSAHCAPPAAGVC